MVFMPRRSDNNKSQTNPFTILLLVLGFEPLFRYLNCFDSRFLCLNYFAIDNRWDISALCPFKAV